MYGCDVDAYFFHNLDGQRVDVFSGFMPVENASEFVASDLRKPCTIRLWQLLPVQRTNTVIIVFVRKNNHKPILRRLP